MIFDFAFCIYLCIKDYYGEMEMYFHYFFATFDFT